MPINPSQIAQQMASGGQPPQPQQPNMQVSPGQVQGGDQNKILEVLKQAVQSSVNQQGYVDINKLVQLWPQLSQQMGINVPFQTVLQMIQQNPELIQDMVIQMGLAGLIINGKTISPEELAKM